MPELTSSVTIRPARPADAARIAALSGQLGYPVAPEEISSRLARLLGCEDGAVLVAELSPEGVIGWTHVARVEILEYGVRAEILGLVVDRTARRHGAGRRLVEAAEQWAVARGLRQIGVRSNITRAESHPFYERLGYERWKTQHAYRKALD
jgi:GNAT superfamily N-acetyltransferase